MKTEEEIWEIAKAALVEMYQEAEPPLDFEEALANAEGMEHRWYTNYYLSTERQQEIVERYCDEHNLNKSERSTVTWIAILHYGPSSVKPR